MQRFSLFAQPANLFTKVIARSFTSTVPLDSSAYRQRRRENKARRLAAAEAAYMPPVGSRLILGPTKSGEVRSVDAELRAAMRMVPEYPIEIDKIEQENKTKLLADGRRTFKVSKVARVSTLEMRTKDGMETLLRFAVLLDGIIAAAFNGRETCFEADSEAALQFFPNDTATVFRAAGYERYHDYLKGAKEADIISSIPMTADREGGKKMLQIRRLGREKVDERYKLAALDEGDFAPLMDILRTLDEREAGPHRPRDIIRLLPPNRAELYRRVGVWTIQGYLAVAEKKGYIKRELLGNVKAVSLDKPPKTIISGDWDHIKAQPRLLFSPLLDAAAAQDHHGAGIVPLSAVRSQLPRSSAALFEQVGVADGDEYAEAAASAGIIQLLPQGDALDTRWIVYADRIGRPLGPPTFSYPATKRLRSAFRPLVELLEDLAETDDSIWSQARAWPARVLAYRLPATRAAWYQAVGVDNLSAYLDAAEHTSLVKREYRKNSATTEGDAVFRLVEPLPSLFSPLEICDLEMIVPKTSTPSLSDTRDIFLPLLDAVSLAYRHQVASGKDVTLPSLLAYLPRNVSLLLSKTGYHSLNDYVQGAIEAGLLVLRSGDDGSAAGAATLAVSAESEEVRPQLVDARTGRPLRAMRVESVETEATKAVGTTATDAVGAKAADAFEPLIEALNRIEGTDISSSDVLRLMPIEGRAQTYDRAGASHFLDYLSAASKAGVVSSDAAAGILSLAAPHRTSLPLSNSLAYARSNPHTFNPKTAFCPLLDLLDLTHAATLHERPNIRASSLSPHLSPSILSLAGVTTAEDYFLAAEGAGMIALYRDRVFQHKADPRVDLRHRRPQTIPYGTPLASLDAFDPLWDALQASRPITAAGSWAGVEVCMKMRAERALTYEYAGVRTFEGYLRMAEALGLVVRTWEDRVRRLGRFRLRLGRRWEAFDLYDRL